MGSIPPRRLIRQGEPETIYFNQKTNLKTENEETLKWLRKHSSAINRT